MSVLNNRRDPRPNSGRGPKPTSTDLGTLRGTRPSRRKRTNLWLLAPALILFGVFGVLPLLGTIALSLTTWSGLGSPQWDGLGNWKDVFSDPVTWTTVKISLQVMVGSWAIQTPLSLLLGVYIAKFGKFRALLAVFYFIPLLLSSAAVAFIYKYLLDANFGLFSSRSLGIFHQDYLGNKNLVLGVVTFIIAWHFVPLHTLLYQGGVRQIPQVLYEAAALDGAGVFKQFFSITLPQLKYTIVTSSTLILVGSLTYFDLVFALTAGGPGYATRLLPLHMYITGFKETQMGKASAIAAILAVVGLTMSLVLTKVTGFNRMESQQEGM